MHEPVNWEVVVVNRRNYFATLYSVAYDRPSFDVVVRAGNQLMRITFSSPPPKFYKCSYKLDSNYYYYYYYYYCYCYYFLFWLTIAQSCKD